MQGWLPSASCLLTLKQLGFSPHQIDQALTTYRQNCDDPDDRGFSKSLTSAPTTSEEQYTQLHASAKIPLNWKPSTATENKLYRLGYEHETISHYCSVFIVRARESDIVLQDPGAAFLEFCRGRPRVLAVPMPPDWIPEVSAIEAVMDHTGFDWDHVTDRLSRFLDIHQYSTASDWNAKFLSWMTSQDTSSPTPK